MATTPTITVDPRKLVSRYTVRVKVKGKRRFWLTRWVGFALLKAGARIVGMKHDVTINLVES